MWGMACYDKYSTVVGMAMLGVIGCTALGFSVIGIVAFGVMVT
jgi:hypothetical protein